YWAYDNYKAYTESNSPKYRELTSGFLLGTGSSALVGIVSSAISSANGDRVQEYDLTKKIIESQIKDINRDIIDIDRDNKRILARIVYLERTN
ncbi:MAG: hypothetical protein JXR64_12680, partial [Spirochaetales bacterium]|nr:hypothetical protein [Spirochaetales bacterium]